MDPNKCLEEIRERANKIMEQDGHEHMVLELAARILDLDEWLKKDGFLPKDWKADH